MGARELSMPVARSAELAVRSAGDSLSQQAFELAHSLDVRAMVRAVHSALGHKLVPARLGGLGLMLKKSLEDNVDHAS